MTDRFYQISQELQQLLLAQVGGEVVEAEIYNHINTHKALMMPEDGWPGSNEVKRKAAATKAEVEDDALFGLNKRLLHCQGRLLDVRAQVEGLRAERRALEWQIRRAMVIQLAATSGISLELDNDDISVVAFEAFIDKESTRAYFELPDEAYEAIKQRIDTAASELEEEEQRDQSAEEPFGDDELLPPDGQEPPDNNSIMTMKEIMEVEEKTDTDTVPIEDIPF